MDLVFWNNIAPTLGTWCAYLDDGKETEAALLRMTVSHLAQVIDESEGRYFPEEMYICPPVTDHWQTGSLIGHKANGGWFVVLSPACDLVLRGNGKPKTDQILICEILDVDPIVDELWGESKKAKYKAAQVKDLLKNNSTGYHYWLPKTQQFQGGVINFRHVTSLTPDQLGKDFDAPFVQIAPQFAKDLVGRFSSNYSRQGQPDFDFDGLTADYIESREN